MSVLVRRIRRRDRRAGPAACTPSVAGRVLDADGAHDCGPRRASDLVELFAIDKGAVSRQVQTLLELGLIERSPRPRRPAGRDPRDHRRWAGSGWRRSRRSDGSRSSRSWHDWSDEDLRGFVEVMSRYNAALERG